MSLYLKPQLIPEIVENLIEILIFFLFLCSSGMETRQRAFT